MGHFLLRGHPSIPRNLLPIFTVNLTSIKRKRSPFGFPKRLILLSCLPLRSEDDSIGSSAVNRYTCSQINAFGLKGFLSYVLITSNSKNFSRFNHIFLTFFFCEFFYNLATGDGKGGGGGVVERVFSFKPFIVVSW